MSETEEDPYGARGGPPLRTAAGISLAATIALLLPRQYIAAAVTGFFAVLFMALQRRRNRIRDTATPSTPMATEP